MFIWKYSTALWKQTLFNVNAAGTLSDAMGLSAYVIKLCHRAHLVVLTSL